MVLTEAEMVKFDNVFLSILQNCGKIEPFLDSIFFFLSRRTDFFHLMYSKNDKLGFPPGIAEKMLIKVLMELSLFCYSNLFYQKPSCLSVNYFLLLDQDQLSHFVGYS